MSSPRPGGLGAIHPIQIGAPIGRRKRDISFAINPPGSNPSPTRTTFRIHWGADKHFIWWPFGTLIDTLATPSSWRGQRGVAGGKVSKLASRWRTPNPEHWECMQEHNHMQICTSLNLIYRPIFIEGFADELLQRIACKNSLHSKHMSSTHLHGLLFKFSGNIAQLNQC